jgi:hypothetical protein
MSEWEGFCVDADSSGPAGVDSLGASTRPNGAWNLDRSQDQVELLPRGCAAYQ